MFREQPLASSHRNHPIVEGSALSSEVPLPLGQNNPAIGQGSVNPEVPPTNPPNLSRLERLERRLADVSETLERFTELVMGENEYIRNRLDNIVSAVARDIEEMRDDIEEMREGL